jgi:acetate kinase
MLYERAGLLGLSGVSGDMRVLEESADAAAVAAFEHFIYAMAKFVGAYVSVLGGLDALVFTAGIGKNSVQVRAALCARLAWLGVTVDARANGHSGPCISAADSRVSVWVIPTDEELMIARHTVAIIAQRASA